MSAIPLVQSSSDMVVYYAKRSQAPYLLEPTSTSSSSYQDGRRSSSSTKLLKRDGQQEADAAAGGPSSSTTATAAPTFSQRVSSFHLLPRVTSADAVQVLRGVISSNNTESSIIPPPPPGLPLPQPFGSTVGLDSTWATGGPLPRSASSTTRILYSEPPLNENEESPTITPSWRLRDRMKTVGVGLVLALNIGTDPPDLVKPSPCATLETWMDPHTVSRAKAKELIGERLEQQYAKWQLARSARPLKYRRATDPTVEDVRTLCVQLRRQARNERVLFHYNGRGVPRPTSNGEIWVFDKNHTEYIPLSILDLRQWLGKPSIVVLDCSAAGILLPSFRAPWTTSGAPVPPDNMGVIPPSTTTTSITSTMDELASKWVNDTIVLCPCAENEWLPMSPDYPADIFTSCLTTPIQIALRWFVRNHPTSMKHVHADAVDLIPGVANDRKTPLGELNWIFTAVTDSIAWNSLPKPLFQRLFRQDLLVASMFRNFLLADRILRSLGCTPVSHPPLPPGMAAHPLWRAWDLACETLLFQLRDSILVPSSVHLHNVAATLNTNMHSMSVQPTNAHPDDDANDGTIDSKATSITTPPTQQPHHPHQSMVVDSNSIRTTSSPFFSEQLTAFEVWLEYAEIHRVGLEPPEQLPVVLQVLLSQAHRVRALLLLRRFLQLGPWAVDLSLSLGIFPYVMKLLQSPEYKSLLVSIWASILAFDPTTRADLLKDGAYHHFVQHILWGLDNANTHSSALSSLARSGNGGTHHHHHRHRHHPNHHQIVEAAEERTIAAFVLAAAAHEYPPGQAECIKLQLHGNCCALLSSYEHGENTRDATVEWHFPPHFRLWLCLCLGNIVKLNTPIQNEAYSAGVHTRLLARLRDRNAEVRAAVCYALGCLLGPPQKQGSRSSSTQDLPNFSQPHQVQQAQMLVQGAANLAPGGFVPQRIAGLPPNMVVPGQFTLSGALPNLHWRPQQHLDSATATVGERDAASVGLSTQQDSSQLGVAPFGSQPMQFRHAPTQGMQPHYVVPGGHQLQGHPAMGVGSTTGPTGFLVGPNQMTTPPMFHHQDAPRQLRPTVYEDRRRLELDLSVVDALLGCAADASVLVRYEAVLGLASGVGRYLDAFIVTSEESTAALNSPSNAAVNGKSYPFPRGLDRRYMSRFTDVWRTLRELQHRDPFPAVSRAASKVVRFVNEHLLRYRMEVDESSDRPMDDSSKRLTKLLSGIEEDLPSSPASLSGQQRTPDAKPVGGRAQTTGRMQTKQELRRVLSEVAKKDESSSMEAGAVAQAAPASLAQPRRLLSYSLPRSQFYDWKKRVFDPTFTTEEFDPAELDLLGPVGAARAYRERRNTNAQRKGLELSNRYACLAPKPPKQAKKSIHLILEEDDDEGADANEEEATSKKNELKLQENLILRNEGVNMTSMLQFHGYEDILVSCAGQGTVSIWDTRKSGKRLRSFENGNPESSRMTSSGWINEESSSLFFVGCDDGSVRMWGGIVENTGELGETPYLRAAFQAVSMKPSQRGSGLVSEWQPYSGIMLAGGNSKRICCWDLQSEQKLCEIETNSDANATTLTTAWDLDQLGVSAGTQGNQSFGRDIFVSGFSDGSIKVFDLRTHCRSSEQTLVESPPSRRPRFRVSEYAEHKSWIVTTAFTGHAGRFELLSGTVAGEVKAWDLRMSSSVRTLDVQRSTMTALAFHSKIPFFATGSHAQFIKVVNLDGDTLQVLRYHEKMANHRIGPVSCLAFHRYKAILAAGSTDSFIGIYTPKTMYEL